MNIKFDPSPNFSPSSQSEAQYGQPRTFQKIVLHWWDDPAKNPTLNGVVATFKNSSKYVSAHYIVDDKTIVQMVREEDVAWHARNANPYSIGIEINPKTPGDTYKTVGELVADICKRRNIQLNRRGIIGHREVVNTTCPGTIDIDRVIREAQTFNLPEPNPGYAPTFENQTVEKDGIVYESYKKDGVLLWKTRPSTPPPAQITEDTIIPQIENKAVKDIKKELFDGRGRIKDLENKLETIKKGIVKIIESA